MNSTELHIRLINQGHIYNIRNQNYLWWILNIGMILECCIKFRRNSILHSSLIDFGVDLPAWHTRHWIPSLGGWKELFYLLNQLITTWTFVFMCMTIKTTKSIANKISSQQKKFRRLPSSEIAVSLCSQLKELINSINCTFTLLPVDTSYYSHPFSTFHISIDAVL